MVHIHRPKFRGPHLASACAASSHGIWHRFQEKHELSFGRQEHSRVQAGPGGDPRRSAHSRSRIRALLDHGRECAATSRKDSVPTRAHAASDSRLSLIPAVEEHFHIFHPELAGIKVRGSPESKPLPDNINPDPKMLIFLVRAHTHRTLACNSVARRHRRRCTGVQLMRRCLFADRMLPDHQHLMDGSDHTDLHLRNGPRAIPISKHPSA